MTSVSKRWSTKKKATILVVALFAVVFLWNIYKPLPEGLSMSGAEHRVKDEDVLFLSDETYLENGERKSTQEIFDYVIHMVRNAKSFILVDMFLWNSFGTGNSEVYRRLSSEMVDELVAKKKADKEIKIVVITDPINTSYGGHSAPHIEALQKAGITVVYTNLPALRDSNPAYSTIWRIFVYPFDTLHRVVTGKDYTFQAVPSLLNGDTKVTLRSYLALMNFKANHRKLIVADSLENGKEKVVTLVSSANPHDGSSAHSNSAVVVKSALWRDVLQSERAVIRSAGGDATSLIDPNIVEENGDIITKLVTEKKIKDQALEMIQSSKEGDSLYLFMFYLSDFEIIEQLKDAARRGVRVSVLIDPNKDAFGREKNGVPNRSVAYSLLQAGKNISVRFCVTNGEQCHTKMLIKETKEGGSLLLGSANYTRRNIGDYNLESNVFVAGENVSAIRKAKSYFLRAWNNEDGRTYSTEYASFKDETKLHYLMWVIMERTGLSTF